MANGLKEALSEAPSKANAFFFSSAVVLFVATAAFWTGTVVASMNPPPVVQELQDHERLPGHPVATQRLNSVEADIKEIKADVREILKTVRSKDGG